MLELSLLKVVLVGLGCGAIIPSHRFTQKAVYLSQFMGADLGYSFGLFHRGPFSEQLQDAHERLSRNPNPSPALSLSDESAAVMRKVDELLGVPKCVALCRDDWAELLATCHFLRNRSRLPDVQARAIMLERRPELAIFQDVAIARLAKEKPPVSGGGS